MVINFGGFPRVPEDFLTRFGYTRHYQSSQSQSCLFMVTALTYSELSEVTALVPAPILHPRPNPYMAFCDSYPFVGERIPHYCTSVPDRWGVQAGCTDIFTFGRTHASLWRLGQPRSLTKSAPTLSY
jgi:hypothetical protein